MEDCGTIVHGTAVAIDGAGVLLRGEPGAGKSDLALRLIDDGAALVSDDQTAIAGSGGWPVLGAPAAIAGMLEVRGVGIVNLPNVAEAPLALIVDLHNRNDIERFPEPVFEIVSGEKIPVIRIAPFEASAPARIRLALRLRQPRLAEMAAE